MLSLSQSEINFDIITAESNFGVRTGETIRCRVINEKKNMGEVILQILSS